MYSHILQYIREDTFIKLKLIHLFKGSFLFNWVIYSDMKCLILWKILKHASAVDRYI